MCGPDDSPWIYRDNESDPAYWEAVDAKIDAARDRAPDCPECGWEMYHWHEERKAYYCVHCEVYDA